MQSGHSGLKLLISMLIRRRLKFLFLVRNRSLSLEPGDGLLYKGCERPHWREAMPGLRRRVRNCLVKHSNKNFTIIKSSSIMFFRMEKEHTALGIEHDEGTTF